ncbi:MAG: type II toxin-antitoxin system VapC family toxin [Thermosynechococcaceae cyanobacterium]
MSLWILDTDHVSLFQRDHPQIVKQLAEAAPADISITIITLEEQIRGRFNMIRRAASPSELILAYRNLHITFDSLKSFDILDFSPAAGAIYSSLLEYKIKIGTQDLRIAAIALYINGILVTRNQRDFAKVPNLVIEDWSTI